MQYQLEPLPPPRRLPSKKTLYLCALLAVSAIATFFLLSFMKLIPEDNRLKELESDLSTEEVREVADDDQTATVNPPSSPTDDYWKFINLPLISVDFAELIKKNPDTVAWISVKSTNINYPVLQSTDNDFYLTHAFDKSKNSGGWIFADHRNDMTTLSQNTIIYGHSRLNSTMFGTLKNALNTSWYNNKENHVIYLSTPTENTMWQVFSVYKADPESYYLTTSFTSEDSYATFIDTITSRSVHDFSANVSASDKILTLSTCGDTLGNSRIVLHARLIKTQARTTE